MPIWIILMIIISYGLFEIVNGVLFNWKLYLMSEKRFYLAGVFGSISTLMLILSLIVGAMIGDGGTAGEMQWWIIPIVALATGCGNFLSAMLVPWIRQKINGRKNKE